MAAVPARPAIEADGVAYLAADLVRFVARTVACLAADHALLAAPFVGMFKPAAVHHHLDPVAVPEDCDLALPLPGG